MLGHQFSIKIIVFSTASAIFFMCAVSLAAHAIYRLGWSKNIIQAHIELIGATDSFSNTLVGMHSEAANQDKIEGLLVKTRGYIRSLVTHDNAGIIQAIEREIQEMDRLKSGPNNQQLYTLLLTLSKIRTQSVEEIKLAQSIVDQRTNDYVTMSVAALGCSAILIILLLIAMWLDHIRRGKAETELKEAKEDLELKVQTRTTALQKANDIKGEFLAIMSHEIRTPLNSILGYIELFKPKDAIESKYMRIVKSNATHLLGILNNLLDISKLEANTEPNEAIDTFELNELINEAIETIQPSTEVCISKSTAKELWVQLDQGHTKQLILNLLSNSAKFTKAGFIRVDIRTTDKIIITVTDSGAGIPEEKLTAVFQPFVQADNSTKRTYGGVGLGLAICQRLVKGMSGTIRLDSSEGIGTTAIVELPLIFGTPVISQNENTLPRASIIVVDDNTANRRLLGIMLRKMGQEVIEAVDGYQCLAILEEVQPEIILMDIEMPGMDGFETTKAIRIKYGQNSRIIACTAHALQEVKDKCFASGMDNWITKPINSQELKRVLLNKK